MTDRRALWSNGTVAHASLAGKTDALRFTEGTPHRVATPTTALRAAPNGPRDRELLWGQVFHVLDISDGVAFGFSRADGYAGYVEAHCLAIHDENSTHWVSSRHTLALTQPDFKATQDRHTPLSLGSEVTVTDVHGSWAVTKAGAQTLFIPCSHLTPLAMPASDPVSVAALCLGTPYLWGGNSSFGIDCSGLVQLACRLSGMACPGDSDQQEKTLGDTCPPGTNAQRGDTLFWKGHVAWVADEQTLLHANAHHMAVAYEPMVEAVTRIAAQGGGPVTRHARLTLAT